MASLKEFVSPAQSEAGKPVLLSDPKEQAKLLRRVLFNKDE